MEKNPIKNSPLLDVEIQTLNKEIKAEEHHPDHQPSTEKILSTESNNDSVCNKIRKKKGSANMKLTLVVTSTKMFLKTAKQQ